MIFFAAATEISIIRSIPSNAQQGLEQAISDAEQIDLRNFLGDVLWQDFVTNKAETKYTNLLNGTTYTEGSYTIEYPGLKKAIAHFALARWYTERASQPTRSGLVNKNTEFSERVSNADKKEKVEQERSNAVFYLDKARRFLNNNSDTYPLWFSTNPQRVDKFKIGSIG